MTTVTFQKPEGVPVLNCHTDHGFNWEVISVGSPVDGSQEVVVEIDLWEGINLLEEAFSISKYIYNHLDDVDPIYEQVHNLMKDRMTKEQRRELITREREILDSRRESK